VRHARSLMVHDFFTGNPEAIFILYTDNIDSIRALLNSDTQVMYQYGRR
jgi:hypothetical protein